MQFFRLTTEIARLFFIKSGRNFVLSLGKRNTGDYHRSKVRIYYCVFYKNVKVIAKPYHKVIQSRPV